MMIRRALVCRLDNMGDMLLAGPAVRAVARHSEQVDVLAGPMGAGAARLLPGVDEVLCWDAPWCGFSPPDVADSDVPALLAQVSARGYDRALILTSFHQSPLPLALLLRMAGVPWIGAHSEDYPGSLLDLRHHDPAGIPEAERALSLARAAGFAPAADDDGRPRITSGLPDTSALTGGSDYIVVHPGASVPARRPSAAWYEPVLRALAEEGYRVVVTGGRGERDLARAAIGSTRGINDLSGSTSLAELASVLGRARAVIAPNTGPAHLAAAAGAPVISLFAPVVPGASQWAPPARRRIILGEQSAPCQGSRARECPVPGHPCLDSITVAEVLSAVHRLSSHEQIGALA